MLLRPAEIWLTIRVGHTFVIFSWQEVVHVQRNLPDQIVLDHCALVYFQERLLSNNQPWNYRKRSDFTNIHFCKNQNCIEIWEIKKNLAFCLCIVNIYYFSNKNVIRMYLHCRHYLTGLAYHPLWGENCSPSVSFLCIWKFWFITTKVLLFYKWLEMFN